MRRHDKLKITKERIRRYSRQDVNIICEIVCGLDGRK